MDRFNLSAPTVNGTTNLITVNSYVVYRLGAGGLIGIVGFYVRRVNSLVTRVPDE